jgi:hypothetical protein
MIDDMKNIPNNNIYEDIENKKLVIHFYISYKSIILDYLIEEVIPSSNKEIIKVINNIKIEFD